MTAVTRFALARLRQSIQIISSIRCAFTGWLVGWTMKQSRPRTSSSTLTKSSPSGNDSVAPRPSGICRWSQICCANWGLARPVNTFSLSASELAMRVLAPALVAEQTVVARHVAGDGAAFGHDALARHARERAD